MSDNLNGEVLNFPRDTTMQLLVKVHRNQMAGEADILYKEKVAAATSKAEVDALLLSGGSISMTRNCTPRERCWKDGSEMSWMIREHMA